MNTEDKSRQLTKEQARERGQIKPAERPSTIQSTPLTEPKIEVVAPAPLDPRTSAQQREAARYESIMRAQERNAKDPLTLRGIRANERRRERSRLKQRENKLRDTQQAANADPVCPRNSVS